MTASGGRGIRVDIQLLRGLAVALVVLFHARVAGLPGGFLGVDLFFVVSGYLMTAIIVADLDGGRFSFAGFYTRRIRRLLPAVYATLAVTAVLSAWLLDAAEFADFRAQLAGSFGLVANVVLWRQADYFNTLSTMKPLLHMWSLAIEEQYYLVLPALLFVCPARWRLAANVMAVLAGFALCLLIVERSAPAAFYLLPFRAWELGLGSIVAVLVRQGRIAPCRMVPVRVAAALVLIAVPLLCDERGHPGWPAIAVCAATAVLMVPGLDLRPRPVLRPFVALGDRSYSLYLVHWPLFALADNVMLAAPPPIVRVALVMVALVWSEAQYRWVEQRYRAMRVDARALIVLAAVPALVLAGCAGWARWSGPPRGAGGHNLGLGAECDIRGRFDFPAACRTGDRPTMLLWGDSIAMHLAGGIKASATMPFAQATRVLCGPFVGLSPVNGTTQPRRWAGRCLDFNDSVIAELAAHPDVRTVVLSSALVQYLPGEERGWRVLARGPGKTVVQDSDAALLLDSLARTVAVLHRMGRRVVLVAPPPAPGFDIGRCQNRLAQGKPTVPAVTSCDFTERRYQIFRAANLAFLREVERRRIVPVFRFDDALCDAGRCRTTSGGIFLYRDGSHLSIAGSALLGRRLDLATRLETTAR